MTNWKSTMNALAYMVCLDTRSISSSEIGGYKDLACNKENFDEQIFCWGTVKCASSPVAELCGLHMSVYFHEYMHLRRILLKLPPATAFVFEEEDMFPANIINGAATLLTFGPRTGYPRYNIISKSFVVVNGGTFPLSIHQVWGNQELIKEARDFYWCDPDHKRKGQQQLIYSRQELGPLTIHEPRILLESSESPVLDFASISRSFSSAAGKRRDLPRIRAFHQYHSHRHFPDCGCPECKRTRTSQRHVMHQEESLRPRRWAMIPKKLALCHAG